MSKKWIISLSIVLGFVAVLLTLFWTLFGLSAVTVSFDSTRLHLTATSEEIVEAGEFRYGSSVLFEGRNKSIQKIYDKASQNEKFAYIRITNIETVFPNKFVIHVVEREELFAIEHDGQVLICDRDLRVLRTSISQNDTILVKGLEIKNQKVQVGDFLDVEQTALKKFHSAFLQNNKDFSQQIGKFAQIDISSYEDEITKKEYVSFELTSHQGKKFIINNPDFAFAYKVQKMFAVESQLFENVDVDGNIINASGGVLEVVKNENNEIVLFDANTHDVSQKQNLTISFLSDCAIKVDNLTLDEYHKRTEKDIYWSLQYLG